MRQIVLRPIIALLTLTLGVTCAISYRTYTSHQLNVLHAREAALRDDLFRMRKLIDQYSAEKGLLPKSLDDLVSGGYLREIPEDPVTRQRDWAAVVGDDPNSPEAGKGVIDVLSASPARSADGSRYNEW